MSDQEATTMISLPVLGEVQPTPACCRQLCEDSERLMGTVCVRYSQTDQEDVAITCHGPRPTTPAEDRMMRLLNPNNTSYVCDIEIQTNQVPEITFAQCS